MCIINVSSNAVVKTLTVGKGVRGVTISPYGKHAFITNKKDNSGSVVDTVSQTVVQTIPVGQGPSGIAFATEWRRSGPSELVMTL